MKNKIRVALLTTSNDISFWQHTVIRGFEKSNFIDLALHIIIETGIDSRPPLAWKFFSKMDNYIFRPSPNALTQSEFRISFKRKLHFKTIEDIDTIELKDFRYDVLINFSGIVPTKNIISSFKYGIWNLAHFNFKNMKSGPPGAWELFHGQPEIWAQLVCISGDISEEKILDQTIACTDWISYSRNANIIYWHAVPLFYRNLEKLYNHGDLSYLKSIPTTSSTSSIKKHSIPSFNFPSTRLLVWHTFKTFSKKISHFIENQFYFDQWILLFNNNSENSHYNLSQYKRILPPKDRFWADPFLIKRDGKYYLFIEELIYKDKLGHLAVMELDGNGNYTTPKIILKKDYHLSYPFLIEDNGNLYMIPETGENKDIHLYKCTNFPYEWQLEKVLMEDVKAVDTTIFKKDNLYWMFTNFKVHKGMSSNVELFLFYSKELVSDQWIPHPLNPIVKDVKGSRSAGNIFIEGNHLIRPSQNCSFDYGYGMTFNKINILDDKNYEEKIFYSIIPDWHKDVLGTHTFNSYDEISVSDSKIRTTRLHWFSHFIQRFILINYILIRFDTQVLLSSC